MATRVLGVVPALTQFTHTHPTPDEITQFYHLKNTTIPPHRPYLWSNTVASLDGVTSLGKTISPSVFALNGMSCDASTDWLLLNAGWAYSDAVLGSAEILRSEPNIRWVPTEEMIEFRMKTLRKKTPYPYNVVITHSGIIPPHHPIITDNTIPTLVFISPDGLRKFENQISLTRRRSDRIHNISGHFVRIIELDGINTSIIEIYPHDTTPESEHAPLDLSVVLKVLRVHYDVQYVDVTAGPRVIGSLIEHKLLDEYRLTKSGSFFGFESSTRRPLIDLPPHTYPHIPVLCYEGVRLGYMSHHLFLRCSIDYSKIEPASEPAK